MYLSHSCTLYPVSDSLGVPDSQLIYPCRQWQQDIAREIQTKEQYQSRLYQKGLANAGHRRGRLVTWERVGEVAGREKNRANTRRIQWYKSLFWEFLLTNVGVGLTGELFDWILCIDSESQMVESRLLHEFIISPPLVREWFRVAWWFCHGLYQPQVKVHEHNTPLQ